MPPNTGPKLAMAMSVYHCRLSVTVFTRSNCGIGLVVGLGLVKLLQVGGVPNFMLGNQHEEGDEYSCSIIWLI